MSVHQHVVQIFIIIFDLALFDTCGKTNWHLVYSSLVYSFRRISEFFPPAILPQVGSYDVPDNFQRDIIPGNKNTCWNPQHVGPRVLMNQGDVFRILLPCGKSISKEAFYFNGLCKKCFPFINSPRMNLNRNDPAEKKW